MTYPFNDDEVAAMIALQMQAETMCSKGIGRFDGMQRLRQQRVELVGGGGDGEMIPIGHHAPLKDRFVATGEYDDGTGVEKAVYVKRWRVEHPCVAPVTYYLYEGAPDDGAPRMHS
jgi:hypothetical protein